MGRKSLQLQQLNEKIIGLQAIKNTAIPPSGWIKTIRTALGMSMYQLAYRLGITRQAVLSIEKREKEGALTIKAMKEVAHALDMKFVYGFVPNEKSLDALIEKRATEIATEIVMRTSTSMVLEDQGNTQQRLQKAIKERTASIVNEMPKYLWD